MIFALGVNYKTPELISPWAAAIRATGQPNKLYIVDNFSCDDVRSKAVVTCRENDVCLLPQENIGYGKALNHGLGAIFSENDVRPQDLLLFGNIDVAIKRIIVPENEAPQAYLPNVKQNGRSTNPFLSKLQRRLLPLYDMVAATMSPLALKSVAGILRVVKFIPSKPYACHGALFAVNGACFSSLPKPIFNSSSFLYCEELEFAESLSAVEIDLVACDISADHIGRVSTQDVTKSVSEFLALWAPSWRNWRSRWS